MYKILAIIPARGRSKEFLENIIIYFNAMCIFTAYGLRNDKNNKK